MDSPTPNFTTKYGFVLKNALALHTSMSLCTVLSNGIFDEAVRTAYIATCIESMANSQHVSPIIMIRDTSGPKTDTIIPLEVHPTWKTLSAHWAKKRTYTADSLSEKMTMLLSGKQKCCVVNVSTGLDILVSTPKALTHTCRKCQTVYFSDVNRIWCMASHTGCTGIGKSSWNHDEQTLVRCWDMMTHEDRRRFVKPLAPCIDDYEPVNPLAKKLWAVVNGRIEVSGSALMGSLQEATEETHLLRVSEPDLKKMAVDVYDDPRDILALVAHHMLVSLASFHADHHANMFMAEMAREEQLRQQQQAAKDKKNHFKWLEKTIFEMPFDIPWDIEE